MMLTRASINPGTRRDRYRLSNLQCGHLWYLTSDDYRVSMGSLRYLSRVKHLLSHDGSWGHPCGMQQLSATLLQKHVIRYFPAITVAKPWRKLNRSLGIQGLSATVLQKHVIRHVPPITVAKPWWSHIVTSLIVVFQTTRQATP